MNKMAAQSHAATIASLGKLIAGLQKYPPSGALSLDGTSYTTAEVVSLLQSIVDALNAVVLARATYTKAVHAAEALASDNGPVVRDLKQSVQMTYAKSDDVLSVFGLTPRKSTAGAKTPEVKVAAAAKAKATRTARGTKGKTQKAEITGNVTGVAITPVTAPVAPAPAVPPAVQPAAATPAVAAPATVSSH
jgi:hypothetical protein